MATFEDKSIILEMLKNDGVYPGDPQVYAISAYRGTGGQPLYHVALANVGELIEAASSPYVTDLVTLWERGTGLTDAGKIFLDTKGACAEEAA